MQKVHFRFTCVAQKCQCSSSLVTVAFVSGCPTKASKKRPPTTGTQFKVCLQLKPVILVKNLVTLVCVSPSQCWFGYCSRLSASKYAWLNIREGEGHIWVRTKVWSVSVRNFGESSRETVCVSTICDEYCGLGWSNVGWRSPQDKSLSSG